MPVRNVLVGNTRSNVKHNNAALPLDVVSITQAAEFLLTGGIPDIEDDGAIVSGERQRMYLHTEGSYVAQLRVRPTVELNQRKNRGTNVFLLKLASQVALKDSGSRSV